MDGSNISDNKDQNVDPNSVVVTLPLVIPLPFIQTPDQSSQSDSSIQKSTMEHQQDPAVVALMPPLLSQTDMTQFLQNNFLTTGIGSAESVTAAYNQANSQAVTSLLDGWINNIQQIQQQTKIETTSPAALALSDYKSRLDKGDPGAIGAAPVMTSMLVLATIFAGGVAGSTLVNAPVSAVTNTIEGAVQAVTSTVASAGDMSAALGLIGALFATAAMYPAVMATLMQGTGGTAINATFAKDFANQVIRQVQDPAFNSFLLNSVTANSGEEPVTPERAQQLVAIVKVVALFNALALMTKVETGHLTSEELTAMVTGKITFDEGDPRTTLVALLQQQLGLISNVQERRGVVESLLTFFDNNPDVETLAAPANSIAGMFNASNSKAMTNQTI
jgi:hypothetical protein